VKQLRNLGPVRMMHGIYATCTNTTRPCLNLFQTWIAAPADSAPRSANGRAGCDPIPEMKHESHGVPYGACTYIHLLLRFVQCRHWVGWYFWIYSGCTVSWTMNKGKNQPLSSSRTYSIFAKMARILIRCPNSEAYCILTAGR
jgi:hypothetical protein